MRVRNLQSYLREKNLIHSADIQELANTRIGIDANVWIRSLPGLKDPLADTLGSLPFNAQTILLHELDLFDRFHIKPLFVFQGLEPKNHQFFHTPPQDAFHTGWRLWSKGKTNEAMASFASANSRNNTDFLTYVYQTISGRASAEVMVAPYLAAAQLSYLLSCRKGDIKNVFSLSSILLYQAPRAILNIDFTHQKYEFVIYNEVLATLQLTPHQFLDACLLSGTEYCLTYPFLNVPKFSSLHSTERERLDEKRGEERINERRVPEKSTTFFNFAASVEFIQQAPLIEYLIHLTNSTLRNEYLMSYIKAKSIILFSPILRMDADGVLSLSILPYKDNSTLTLYPYNFSQVVGNCLPIELITLMSNGVLGKTLLHTLSTGQWTDCVYDLPMVESYEYRDLMDDVREYRYRALGLLLSHLGRENALRNLSIGVMDYNSGQMVMQTVNAVESGEGGKGMAWNVGRGLIAEFYETSGMRLEEFPTLQEVLLMHKSWDDQGKLGALMVKEGREGKEGREKSGVCAVAEVFLTFLESIRYFTETGGVTVFGAALIHANQENFIPALCLLEIMKGGALSDELTYIEREGEEGEEEREERDGEDSETERAVRLICRVVSLVTVQITNSFHYSDQMIPSVEFARQMCAFLSIVKSLMRTLRTLMEACVAKTFLAHPTLMNTLPMRLYGDRVKPEETMSPFPSFHLEKNLMFNVAHVILTEKGSPAEVYDKIHQIFVGCPSLMEDLGKAISLWNTFVTIVRKISSEIQVPQELLEDIEHGSRLFDQKILPLYQLFQKRSA